MVESPAQRILDRKQFNTIICGQRIQRKRRTEQLSVENSIVMEFKSIYNDGALADLAGQIKELNATNILST